MTFLEKTALNAVEEIGKYVDLKRAGNNYKGLCLFHAERTPSFFVFPQKGRYRCFGCGKHGDLIDFIQHLKGFSFPEALAYLGIEQGPLTRERKAEIELGRRKKAALQGFREWENSYHSELCLLLRCINRAARLAHDRLDLEALAKLYHRRTAVERCLDALEHGTNKEKFALYMEWKQTGANDTSSFKHFGGASHEAS